MRIVSALIMVGIACHVGAACASGYRVLFRFGLSNSELGYSPATGPVFGPHGGLFGTAGSGGAYDGGTLYRVTPTGKIQVLFNFPEYAFPYAQPSWDKFGDMFVPSAGAPKVIRTFIYIWAPDGRSTKIPLDFDGTDSPIGFDRDGNLVDDTDSFVYTTSPRTHRTIALRYFPDGSPTDGNLIQPGRLVMDAHGNLYGGTYLGGTLGQGTIFRLSPTGKETVLYNFPDPYGCAAPNSGLILDAAGNLYGTTVGGTGQSCIFKLSASGQYTMLHQFTEQTEGYGTTGGLAVDAKGNFYGTNLEGGPQGGGTLFKYAPDGKLTILYAFHQGPDYTGANGFTPNYGLAIDASGNIFGTTARGGTNNYLNPGYGVLFEYSP